MSSTGRILMTVATAIYGLVPPIVDLGATHAMHPDWTPHARLHMVWLVVTMSSMALIALYFIWRHPDRRFGVHMGGLLGLCAFGGFLVSAATAPLDGGSLHDKGGVPEVAGMIDANLLGFGLAIALLLIGWLAGGAPCALTRRRGRRGAPMKLHTQCSCKTRLVSHQGSRHTEPASAHFSMKSFLQSTLAALLLCVLAPGWAQVPVAPAADHAALLASSDPKLAHNKRLVYDFWREVFEAGHMDLAEKYMSESYIQHNPNVPTGRAAFTEFFSKFKKPRDIQPRVSAPLVAITAEGDLVVLSFVREVQDPKDPTKKYTTTWFDMFRIQDGKIAEHWDPAVRQ